MRSSAVAERPRDACVIEYFGKSLDALKNGTIQKLGYGFLFAFHSNYADVLYHFRDEAQYWLKIAIFSYPLNAELKMHDQVPREENAGPENAGPNVRGENCRT